MYIQLPVLTLTWYSDQHVLQEMTSVCLQHNIFMYSIKLFLPIIPNKHVNKTILSLLTKPTIVESGIIMSFYPEFIRAFSRDFELISGSHQLKTFGVISPQSGTGNCVNLYIFFFSF